MGDIACELSEKQFTDKSPSFRIASVTAMRYQQLSKRNVNVGNARRELVRIVDCIEPAMDVFVPLVPNDSVPLFQTEQCRAELERARHVVRLAATHLADEEHDRQRTMLAHIHAAVPTVTYESRRFALAYDTPLCPQPNTTMFPPPVISRRSSLRSQEKQTSKATGRAASRVISVRSLFRVDENSDPYIAWMKKLHGHLNRDEAVCDGPQFKGLNSVTDDQLWGVVSLLLANHGAPLCPICDQMVDKLATMVYMANRFLLNICSRFLLLLYPFIFTFSSSNLSKKIRSHLQEEEEHLNQIMFASLPGTQAICSTILPSCYANYAAQAANVTNGTECMKCAVCSTALTVLQQRFLLDAQAVKSALAWLNGSFIHNICAELCKSFPPNSGSLGGFFPHGVNYTECVAFSNEAFLFAVNAAKNILKPEYFCSLSSDHDSSHKIACKCEVEPKPKKQLFQEMGWCQPNETPNIVRCLRQLCEEGLPVQLATTVCKIIPDEPVSASRFTDMAQYGPKLFPTEQNAKNARYKSEL
ncbi:unnamed protein product [Toxocara canis]|uniref:Saposin B-type domain-containing protein n=1 Tax=Toxocara canis TaxID=6265 RepID=A0A183UK26_TOXCA|nr:unnamed protein product [Toxocara canis]